MDDTQRSLVGGAGIALVPAAIAWAALFPSGSWVVKILPAVAIAVVGAVLFVVAFAGRPGGLGRSFKKKTKIDPAIALEWQQLQERNDRLKEYLNELYREGQRLLQVSPEMGFADQAENWAFITYVILDKAFGEFLASLFFNPLEILPEIETDPRDRHRYRLNSLHRTIDNPATFRSIKETLPLNWEPPNKQVASETDDV